MGHETIRRILMNSPISTQTRFRAVVSLMSFLYLTPAYSQPTFTERFDVAETGLVLSGPTRTGAFVDVVGKQSALLGFEQRPFEAWIYPLKIFSDFQLTFRLKDYPGEFLGTDLLSSIDVRPEATTLTYRHAAFTVRQIIFAPVDEPAIIMLLEVDAVRPLSIIGSFRSDLRLMWPAGLMTGSVRWDDSNRIYNIVEDSGRFVGLVGVPEGRDISVMPYQEEPKDTPTRFIIETDLITSRRVYYPIVVSGGVAGKESALDANRRILSDIPSLYKRNVRYYRKLLDRSTSVIMPDLRLNQALDWAVVGIDKGFATNPLLGTGLVAGFRTSGNSERPGYAWYFGRDALWTIFALLTIGEYESSRTALDFLQGFQREDGKIPHEISQSASLVPWFDDYPYAWASADATPLYVIVHADYFRSTGDIEYLRSNWSSIKAAFDFSRATDLDGNGLIENTGVGHGWVEGGALYPPHEEVYMQGLFASAADDISEMAEAVGDSAFALVTRRTAETTRTAMEETFWLPDEGTYAFATRPTEDREEMGLLNREDTVLPAVPLLLGQLDADRAQDTIDHIGSAAMATDWGTRIISNQSTLYDPLSYHYGSVWPLFTGWASMAAYRYGRPSVGYQALMANALLTDQDARGYITELISGDFNTAFGRSSHHQIWSEAMVVTPLLRGMLGLSASEAGQRLSFRPQLPADWDSLSVRGIRVGENALDISYVRDGGTLRIEIERQNPGGDAGAAIKLDISPTFPQDAAIRRVTIDGGQAEYSVDQFGDRLLVSTTVEMKTYRSELVFEFIPGTDIVVPAHPATPGSRSRAIRVLRSRAESDGLYLVVEGLGQQSYTLMIRSRKRLSGTEGVSIQRVDDEFSSVDISFEGPKNVYVRRELKLEFK
jgi:glycogen debranching enzyme